ncbi:lysylphosphatidylglycerol synthase transmembrane domain-containing protein [Nocardiopsis potens]|uniref:lysylphosphatidylglycerol synthase transmembrane domain-containing protein n=1 Tax=Nocardiopsis potens TaxID=1246458 RepID=UPI00034753C5|nr:lysylphosphatidylglycerol synthase transmembrane domain-containing protein [Nocardiopsis potens]
MGGLAVLAALAWWFSADAFAAALLAIDGRALAAALGIGLATTVLSAWRWRIVAHGVGLRLPPAAALADYYRALFLNAVLPGGVLGDVHRGVAHGRRAGDVGRGVRAVVLERSAGQAVLVAVGAAVLLLAPPAWAAAGRPPLPGPQAAVWAAVAAAAAGAFAAWARWGRGGHRVRCAAAAFAADLRGGLLSRRAWPGVLLLSAAVLAGHVALFAVAAHTAGAAAPPSLLVPLALFALLVMGVPVNAAGWGPREAASAAAFAAAGLTAEQGLAASVAYGALALAASLPGAAVLLFRRRPGRAPGRPAGPDAPGEVPGPGSDEFSGPRRSVPVAHDAPTGARTDREGGEPCR